MKERQAKSVKKSKHKNHVPLSEVNEISELTGPYLDKKTVKKLIRSILEVLALVLLVWFVISTFFLKKEYFPYKEAFRLAAESGTDNGFIALSYFAVDLNGTQAMISSEMLDKHICALKESGYVTITQQDVIDYYKGETLLPEKSLFLIFEDGRRDSAIFAQKSLEKYNYIATMVSYAENLNKSGMRTLSGKDLRELRKSSFWEIGSNGYRLSYINVFDRYENYLGELTIEEFASLRKYMDRDYDHYLMDYLRDEDKVVIESYKEIAERLAYDYQEMERIFMQELGALPELYILMHSNTHQYGTNHDASAINEKWLKSMFELNFNRDGISLNHLNESSNTYDLTRMSPQPYWSVNHLLMRIYSDTGQEVTWLHGDEEQYSFWMAEKGAAEFDSQKEQVIVTTLPNENGYISLKEHAKDVSIQTMLRGNKFGNQCIDLRADYKEDCYIRIEVENNILTIYERMNNETNILAAIDLSELDGTAYQTKTENREEALVSGSKVKRSQRYKPAESKLISYDLQEKLEDESVEDDDLYIPVIQMNEAGKRKLEIELSEYALSVFIDDKEAANVTVHYNQAGSISLGAAWFQPEFEQSNVFDNVYDAIFEKLIIEDSEKGILLFDNCLSGKDLATKKVKEWWKKAAGWFAHMV